MKDHRVLWVNTIGLRAAKPDRFTLRRGFEKLKEWMRPLRQINENLWVLAPVMLPVAGDRVLGRLNRAMASASVRRAMRQVGIERPVLWASVPTAVDFVGQLDESLCAYYVTDDFSLWPGGNAQRIREMDRRMTEQSDIVFPCSPPLEQSHRFGRARVVLLPHAVDYEHFVAPQPEPADLSSLPHPRACFFGLIYEKIDLDLLRRLAREMPQLHVVMIGPVKTDVSRLQALPNVHFLGPKAYDVLPAYLQHVDVLVAPYVPDEEILASGPLKIRECLAVGRPTVVRDLPSIEEFGDLVRLYHDPDSFMTGVRDGLAEQGDSLCARMRGRVQAHSWESRVGTIMEELAKLRPRNADRRARR
jgi:glycosyltransferase involved in cell wall biosynthesis